MIIGVFDSGVGGLSVANALRKALPEHKIILRQDKQHVPYGVKPPEELLGLVLPIFRELIGEGSEVIVIACNTVSTTLLGELRSRFQVPLIAVEPMVEAAASLTESNVIAVCATPTTLTSARYVQLKAEYAQGIVVLEPDCSDWAYMIEHNRVDKQKINERINQVLQKNADVIVLGCTHYHWIEQEIKTVAEGRAQILQPEPMIIQQVKQVLAQLS